MRSMFVNRRDEQGTREGRLSVFISEECSRSREEKPLWAMENKEEKPHVAKKSDSFSLSVFVLWQNEGPGHTLGGGTSWGVHLRSLPACSVGNRLLLSREGSSPFPRVENRSCWGALYATVRPSHVAKPSGMPNSLSVS